ncbi:MAG: hypothetical protein Q9221_008180 [Calogaya cf. arnoldii]
MATMKIITIALSVLSTMPAAYADHREQTAAPSTDPPSRAQQAILQHPINNIASDAEDKTAPKEIIVSVEPSVSTIPTDLTVHETSLNYWTLGQALNLAKTKAQELHLDQVASDIETWVKHHPYKAAFYLASTIGFFAPEILSLPALEALGFGFAGVRAG